MHITCGSTHFEFSCCYYFRFIGVKSGSVVLENCLIIFNALSRLSSSFIISTTLSAYCIVRFSTMFSVYRNECNLIPFIFVSILSLSESIFIQIINNSADKGHPCFTERDTTSTIHYSLRLFLD